MNLDQSSGARYALLDLHVPSAALTLIVMVIVLSTLICFLRCLYKSYGSFRASRNRQQTSRLIRDLAANQEQQNITLLNHAKAQQDVARASRNLREAAPVSPAPLPMRPIPLD